MYLLLQQIIITINTYIVVLIDTKRNILEINI